MKFVIEIDINDESMSPDKQQGWLDKAVSNVVGYLNNGTYRGGNWRAPISSWKFLESHPNESGEK